MATFADRVARAEARLQEQVGVTDGLRDAVASLDKRVDSLDQRIERRFEAIDRRFEAIDRRFEAVDRRFEALDAKISRQFLWLVGIQLTTLTAIVATLATR